MEIVEVLQQPSYRKKRIMKLKDRNDEFLGFDLVFVDQNITDFNFIFCYYWLFSKIEFPGISISYMKL